MYSKSERLKTETNDVFDVNNQLEIIDETLNDLRRDENQCIVKQIVDKRVLNGKVEYRVKYTKDQWIDKESHDFHEMIDSYEQSLRDNNRENNEVINENESIETNTDYKRDSFDDRVCDDLSEVLLSYLSFEDKFGFECISKQWKSIVFNKQKKLCLNYYDLDLVLKDGKLDSKSFEDILKKCKFIDSIDISSDFSLDFGLNEISVENRELILQLITKHCNYLKSMRYDFRDIDIKTIESFGHKFGKSLQVLEISELESIEKIQFLYKFCQKLVSIKGIDFEELFDKNGELLLITERLESMETIICTEDYVKHFEKFIDKYKQTINELSIGIYLGENTDKYLIQLSKVINLKKLNIDFLDLLYVEMNDSLNNSLALISDKCKKLEKLDLNNLYYPEITDSPTRPLKLSAIFKQLKYLSIDTNLLNDNNSPISVKSFKDFKNLIQLNVRSYELFDDFYVDIDKYLPQLRILKVFHRTQPPHVVSELTFNHLSKLTNIEKLKISGDMNFSVKGFEYLIKNCKTIKSIELRDNNNHIKQYFTQKTVNSLISLAVERPETQFKFDFHISNYIQAYWDELMNKPNNIVISY